MSRPAWNRRRDAGGSSPGRVRRAGDGARCPGALRAQLHFGALARGLQPTQRLKNQPPQEHDLSDRQRPEDRRGNVADAAIGLVAAGLIEIVEARLGTRSQALDLVRGFAKRRGGLGVHVGGDGGRGEVSGLAAEHCRLLVVPFAQFFERPLVHAAIPCPLST